MLPAKPCLLFSTSYFLPAIFHQLFPASYFPPAISHQLFPASYFLPGAPLPLNLSYVPKTALNFSLVHTISA